MLAAACRRHPRAVAVGGSFLAPVCPVILSFAVVLFLAAASSAKSSSTTVSFTVMPAIEVLEWPTATFSMSGGPGNPVVMGPMEFRVRANAQWGLTFYSDVDGGRMREFDQTTGSYVDTGRSLTHSLEWALSPDGPWSPVTDIEMFMVSGKAPTGASGEIVQLYLRQPTTFDDVSLPVGREYRIVLTYTAMLDY